MKVCTFVPGVCFHEIRIKADAVGVCVGVGTAVGKCQQSIDAGNCIRMMRESRMSANGDARDTIDVDVEPKRQNWRKGSAMFRVW